MKFEQGGTLAGMLNLSIPAGGLANHQNNKKTIDFLTKSLISDQGGTLAGMLSICIRGEESGRP